MGEMGKDFCPNFLQPFFENLDKMSCNGISWELFPVVHNPHRKCDLLLRTLEYLLGVPS